MSKHEKGHVGHSGILNPATVIFFCAVAQSILGITILFSASLPVNQSDPYFFIGKQAMWIAITCAIGYAAYKTDLEWARKFIWFFYALCAAALVAVLIPGVGTYVNGSRSWIRLGAVSFQVAEFAKLGMVFFVAHYFSLIRHEVGDFWKGFIYPCLGIGAYIGLIILQPDLGTALIMTIASVCLLYLAGTRLVFLLPSVTAGLAGVVALIYHDTERWSRLTAFWNMEAEKAGDAYQGWQALLAFGAGGLDGVGLGQGRQQLSFLPEAHTDFIFAIIGEELGLIATLAVVATYLVQFVAGLMHLRNAPNTYQFLLAGGCVLMISVQSILNLGVVTGVLPTTGLPLPFISYGGSNFLTMGMCVALLLNTSVAWRRPAMKESKRKLRDIE